MPGTRLINAREIARQVQLNGKNKTVRHLTEALENKDVRPQDFSIRELAELIRDVVGFQGQIRFDPAMPDGTPRKLLDVTRLHSLGWRARTTLRQGIESTLRWYLDRRGQP